MKDCIMCLSRNRDEALFCTICGQKFGDMTLTVPNEQKLYALQRTGNNVFYWTGNGWAELSDAYIANDPTELEYLRSIKDSFETLPLDTLNNFVYDIVEIQL